MIVKTLYTTRSDGVRLFETRSDKGMLIRKVGTMEVYDVAIDVEESPFVYVETDIPVPTEGGDE